MAPSIDWGSPNPRGAVPSVIFLQSLRWARIVHLWLHDGWGSLPLLGATPGLFLATTDDAYQPLALARD